jgi:hypothetical protein
LAWWYMALLAFQFGAQPILTKKFTPKTICRSTIVLAQDVVRSRNDDAVLRALFVTHSSCFIL